MSDRTDYDGAPLDRDDLGDEPLAALAGWIDDAIAAAEPQPHAMALATGDPGGHPSVRYVLLRGIDERGLVFFTDRESRKGQGLARLPAASVALYWPSLHRQVRCDGPASPVPATEADHYWASRPRGARIAAMISRQSSEVPDRRALEEAFARALHETPDPVPRPERWGGYRLAPERIEFWQGRPNRLHDRIQFERAGATWRKRRLAP